MNRRTVFKSLGALCSLYVFGKTSTSEPKTTTIIYQLSPEIAEQAAQKVMNERGEWKGLWKQYKEGDVTYFRPVLGWASIEAGPTYCPETEWIPSDWKVFADGKDVGQWVCADDGLGRITGGHYYETTKGTSVWGKNIRFVYIGGNPRFAAFREYQPSWLTVS